MSIQIHTRDTEDWKDFKEGYLQPALNKAGSVKNNIVKNVRKSRAIPGKFTIGALEASSGFYLPAAVAAIPALAAHGIAAGGTVVAANRNARRFNEYKCADVILNKPSRKDWTAEDNDHCKAPYEQSVFHYAYENGDESDKKRLNDALNARCFKDNVLIKNPKEYKLFCKDFVKEKVRIKENEAKIKAKEERKKREEEEQNKRERENINISKYI